MTYWQLLVWDAWLELQWNRPNRTDHYIHQNTCAIAGKDVEMPKFVRKDNQQTLIQQNWASTTDDDSGWWEPEPLTPEQYQQLIKVRPVSGRPSDV